VTSKALKFHILVILQRLTKLESDTLMPLKVHQIHFVTTISCKYIPINVIFPSISSFTLRESPSSEQVYSYGHGVVY